MYCPKSDQQVAQILSRFVGREVELLGKVRQKYGALPAGTALPTPSGVPTSEEGEPPTPAPEPEQEPEFDLAAGFIAKPPSGDHSLDGEGAQTWRAQHKERSEWEENGWYKSVTLHPDGTYDWSYTTYNIDLYDYDRSTKVTEAHGQWTVQVPGQIRLDGVQGTRTEWDSFKEYLDGNPDYQGATTLARTLRRSDVHLAFRLRRGISECGNCSWIFLAGEGQMSARVKHSMVLTKASLAEWTHSASNGGEPWCARRLAFGMCLQNNLGAHSPANNLSDDVARMVATHLHPFAIFLD
jgi:hypothetical protein